MNLYEFVEYLEFLKYFKIVINMQYLPKVSLPVERMKSISINVFLLYSHLFNLIFLGYNHVCMKVSIYT